MLKIKCENSFCLRVSEPIGEWRAMHMDDELTTKLNLPPNFFTSSTETSKLPLPKATTQRSVKAGQVS